MTSFIRRSKRRPLTQAARDALLDAVHLDKVLGVAIVTGRGGVRRTATEPLVRRGLLECIGTVEMVDGDGFHYEPTRLRIGYRLTAEGRAAAERLAEEDAQP